MGVEDPTVADDAAASMSSHSLADLSGSLLQGRYRMTRLVGSGSMGDVYDGVDLSTRGRVALKVLKPERAVREVFRHRFLREAKSAVMIDHPNVVDVLDYGEEPGGLLFIVMEFLEGEDLSSYLHRNRRLQWPHAVAVLSQVAAALAAAHDCGVVHRDVKPSNILLRQDGTGGLIVKLLDFGVAKLDKQMVSRVLTRAEDVVGTVLYMSPEQAEGRAADLRSDVYAFGVTAFQTMTGEVPFPGRDLFKVMSAHLTQPPPDPRRGAPEMPPWGSRFVLRCLEKNPETRYQSMHDVLAVLAGKATPDLVSVARPGTPIAEASDERQEQHPPLGGEPLLEPPTADEFDDAPTAYFQAAVIPSSLATAPRHRSATLRTSPDDLPTAIAAASASARHGASSPAGATTQKSPRQDLPTTVQPRRPASMPPAEQPRTYTPPPPEPIASPFGPQDAMGQTVPVPIVPDEPDLDEPPPSKAIYVVLAIGVLAVLAALAIVVGS